MGWLTWIALGLVVGVLAKVIMPGKDPGGLVMTTILGIAGAVVGGWISTQLGLGAVRSFSLPSLAIATRPSSRSSAVLAVTRPGCARRCT